MKTKTKLTTTIFLHRSSDIYKDSLYCANTDCSQILGYPLLGSVTLDFDFDMPSEQDIVLAEVALLEEKKDTVAKEAASSIRLMQNKINSLLAIENKSEERENDHF